LQQLICQFALMCKWTISNIPGYEC